ncbi:MAG: zinc-dependent peptidase [Agriterribacter sp.]
MLLDASLIILLILSLLAFIFIVAVLLRKKRKAKATNAELPATYRQLLEDNVAFYKKLSPDKKTDFEKSVQHFLSEVRITGVGTEVEDLDRVLIGASAVIPIFSFPRWEYVNIDEILLYPETFNEEFETSGNNRSVLGMVGTGVLQRMMILSRHALREGFSNKTDKNNTAIHEFVHLIDKTDGAVDGIPELLMQHQYTLPWLDMIHKNIKAIKNHESDINVYGATNQAEFFAVVSEYFFERPDLLKNKHPELYEMLEKIFHKPTPN